MGIQSFRSVFVPASRTQTNSLHGNRTTAYRFLFLFTRERNRFVPQLFLRVLSFFTAATTSSHALRTKILSFCFMNQLYNSLPAQTGTELNDCVFVPFFASFFSSFQFLERNDVI